MFYKAFRLFRTVKYLKWSQIYWRAYYRMTRGRAKLTEPPKRASYEKPQINFINKKPSMKNAREFIFFNQVGNLDEIGWQGKERSKLWRYNQHYFDNLNSLEAHKYVCNHSQLISEWISHNPIGLGVGWDPYPTSLRIVNWIKWDITHQALSKSQTYLLAQMSQYLLTRVEKHLRGNHMLANAKALIFAGLYFEGIDADKWLLQGANILNEELPEQILEDGGHFEQSPMYHSIILEDLLDIKNIFLSFTQPEAVEFHDIIDLLNTKITKMLFWLHTMIHPDGEISFFNDSTFGIASQPTQIFGYAQRLGFQIQYKKKGKLTLLSSSGYFRILYPKIFLLGNIGDICARYIPGHAHADTLSFEMSVGNKRVFVNSGISKYGTDCGRIWQRSTHAHSTLTINDKNSSEVWSGFRVGRRAKVKGVETKFEDNGGYRILAQHTGYVHLKGKPVHEREWKITKNKLTISDKVYGVGAFDVAVYYYLSPDFKLTVCGTNSFKVVNQSNQAMGLLSVDNADVSVRNTQWYPGFGLSVENLCIVLSKKVYPKDILSVTFELI